MTFALRPASADGRALLFVGILLGWLAAVCAHLVAHRYAGACVEFLVPVTAAPVLPGV